MGQDPLAVQGQPGTLAGTTEQGEAHFFFQLFDDVAELGLGDVHGPGSPGKWTRTGPQRQNSEDCWYPWEPPGVVSAVL